MEKLLNYSLKFLLICFVITVFGCNNSTAYYKKSFSKERELQLADQFMNGMGYTYYYQGNVGEQMLIEEAKLYNDQHPEVFREQGIPYLKRGIANKFFPHYCKMAEADPEQWLGNKAYCIHYFFRDYERALADYDTLDAWTPNFVDYPFALSVDYLRAICYHKLKQPRKAIEYMDKHIAYEAKTVGKDYIYPVAFILKGLAHEDLNQLNEAKLIYEDGIKFHPKNADLKYYLGKLQTKLGNKVEAANLLMSAREQFNKGEFNSRSYVEEFYQIYIQDIEEAEMRIDK